MRPSNLQTTIYRLCVLSSLMFFASAGNATSSNNPINLDDVNGPFTYTLVISNGISDNSPLFLNDGANLDLNDDNETIGSLAGDGNVFLGSGTLTTGSAGSTTFNGVISESGGLTKVGGTTFTLTGDSTYDGLTTINGGALTLDGSLDAGNNVELAMSNTTLNGTGEIIGRMTQINAGVTNASVSGSLTLENSPTVVNVLGSGSVSGATIQNGSTGINVTPTGTITLTNNTVTGNTTGINVDSGGTVFFNTGNEIIGGATGLLVTGPTPMGTGIGNLTLSNTVFTGQLTKYITLQNLAHQEPDLIDGSNATFDGLAAATIDASETLRDAWELLVDHFPDDNDLGFIILHTSTAYIDPDSGDLIVIGSYGNDQITVDSTDDSSIVVKINTPFDTFDLSTDPDARVIVFGIDGRDFIQTPGNRMNEVFAGNGDDTVYGGNGTDLLRGGNGDDFLNGQEGDDVLFGGRGADRLTDSMGDNVFVGGRIIRRFDLVFQYLQDWTGGMSAAAALSDLVPVPGDDPDDSDNRDRISAGQGTDASIHRPGSDRVRGIDDSITF